MVKIDGGLWQEFETEMLRKEDFGMKRETKHMRLIMFIGFMQGQRCSLTFLIPQVGLVVRWGNRLPIRP